MSKINDLRAIVAEAQLGLRSGKGLPALRAEVRSGRLRAQDLAPYFGVSQAALAAALNGRASLRPWRWRPALQAMQASGVLSDDLLREVLADLRSVYGELKWISALRAELLREASCGSQEEEKCK